MNILFFTSKEKELMARVAAGLPDVRILTADDDDELRKAMPETDIIVTSNRVYVDQPAKIIIDGAKRLKWIHFNTSGIDKAIKSGLPEGVPVTNSAGFHAARIAQHAMSLLLAVARRHNDAAAARATREWVRDVITPKMVSLEKRNMVVIGLGSIGQELARKAKAFDMRVIGISRSNTPMANVDEIRPRERLLETLREADVVALAASYDETTHHMIDTKALAAMKPTTIIVNVARGLLIDEEAMIKALRAETIYGAGIDVMSVEPLPPESPLWDLKNVVLTPHSAGGGGGDDKVEPIFQIIAENYKRLKAGQPMIKLVYGPATAKIPA